MTHPLTDDMLKQIQSENPTRIYGTQAMLAAYDLGRDEQLEQVIEWLRHNLGSVPLDPVGYSGHEIDVDYVIEDLREDMRPTTTQENN